MYAQIAEQNLKQLQANTYPGRGIVLGATPDGKFLVQLYWIMGRSENSRNRVFVNESGFVRTKAHDESKVTDPSLIIYYPVKSYDNYHIVSNGDQTDTVYEFLRNGKAFEEALNTRTFEPDAPNFTPRITGITEIGGEYTYKLSILKSQDGNSDYCIRNVFQYTKAIPGFGHCLHTYSEDANPLPGFRGEPYLVPLSNDLDATLQQYWKVLNTDNRVSLLAKYINLATKESVIRIINKHL